MGKNKGGKDKSKKTDYQKQQQNKQEERKTKRSLKKQRVARDMAKYEQDLVKFRIQLAEYGLKLKEIGGDGNCLFRSISDQLRGNEHDHFELRHEAIIHMRENAEFFKFYIEDDEDINDYLDTMSRDGIWGGQLEMNALSQVFKFNVIIH